MGVVSRNGIIAGGALLACTTLCVVLLYLQASAALLDEVRQSLIRLAAGASTVVDMEALTELDEGSEEWGETYLRVFGPLDRYRNTVPSLRFVYTVRLVGDQVVFIVDGTPLGDSDHDGVEDHAHLAEVYDDAEQELYEVLRTGVSGASPEPYDDVWGTMMTGYAPLRDRNGVLVGALGVDITVEQYVAARAGLVRGALMTELVALLLSLAAAWVVSRQDTARSLAERALSDQQQRQFRFLSHVLDALDHPLFVVDQNHQLQGCNQAFATSVGRRREDVIGRPWNALLPTDAATRQTAEDERAFESTGPVVSEERFGTPLRTLVTRRVPGVGVDGAPMIVGVVFDVTEDRTREEVLKQARQEAEAAFLARTRFLANMSHELRTPMNGVLGMTDLLLGTALDEEQRSYADTVNSSARGLLGLLDEILDFSKIEAGRVEFESIPVRWVDAVEEVATLVATRAQDKGLEVIVEVAPDVPVAGLADPVRVRQVLLNLLTNAVKFTPSGHVRVRVRPDEGGLRFSVEDTGIGLSEDSRKRLFGVFHQADASTTRKFGGTGLGLSISKGLVEQMGGTIGVDSALGEGSTFWFTLPTQQANLEPASSPPVDRPIVLALSHHLAHHALDRWLAACRAQVHRATSLSAVAELRLTNPIVVLDSAWATDGGAERLTAAGALVIVAAPIASVADSRTLPGVREVVPRPVRRAALVAALNRMLDRGPVTPEVRSPVAALGQVYQGRVLLAEDDAVNRRVALLFLRRHGIEADVAENGREAVEMVRRTRYALVLMDCQMPEVDGYEATRTLREEGATVPICALTANAMEEDRRACEEVGMNDFLAKPLRREALAEVLRRWLGHGTTVEA